MNRYKRVENRDQLDDMIAPDNEVRAIDAIVDSIGLISQGQA